MKPLLPILCVVLLISRAFPWGAQGHHRGKESGGSLKTQSSQAFSPASGPPVPRPAANTSSVLAKLFRTPTPPRKPDLFSASLTARPADSPEQSIQKAVLGAEDPIPELVSRTLHLACPEN